MGKASSRFIDLLVSKVIAIIEGILDSTDEKTFDELFLKFNKHFSQQSGELQEVVELFNFFNLKEIDVRNCSNPDNWQNKNNIAKVLIKLTDLDSDASETICTLLVFLRE